MEKAQEENAGKDGKGREASTCRLSKIVLQMKQQQQCVLYIMYTHRAWYIYCISYGRMQLVQYRQEDSFFFFCALYCREKKERRRRKRKRTRENSWGTAAQGSIRTDVDVGAHLSQVRLDKREEGGTLRCTLIAHLYCALPSTQHEPNQLEIIPGNDRTGLTLTCH